MLENLLYFWCLALAVVFTVIFVRIGWRWSDLRAYFWGTKQGKGILKGIVMVLVFIPVFGVILALTSSKAQAQSLKIPGKFFTDASLFMGLDHTKKLSPQCVAGGIDDRTTSNVGARLNVWESPSTDVRLNLQYTHHSCALNVDRNGYDALGIQVEWRFPLR